MVRRYTNALKTALLLGVLTALILTIGYALGGSTGLIMTTVLSLVTNGAAYFYSDTIALHAMAARPVNEAQTPELHAMVRELATNAGEPMPRLYVSPIAQPNAFATGRNPRHAAVCVTDGILRLLTPRELRAVLGHELSHVYNRDILTSSVAAALAGILTSLANLALFLPIGSSTEDDDAPHPLAALLMLVLAPVAAGLLQLAISRSREYQADADGADLSGDPLALASALQKIDQWTRQLPLPADAPHAAYAHLMIAHPLSDDGVAALFSTHPPTAERIRRLRQLASQVAAGPSGPARRAPRSSWAGALAPTMRSLAR